MGPLPADPMYMAMRLPGRAFDVYFVLWHEAGFNDFPTVLLSNQNRWLRRAGIDRHAKWRALKALKKAGLINVEKRGKASPLVTILDWRPVCNQND